MTQEMDKCVVRGMMATTLRLLRLFGLAPLSFYPVGRDGYLISYSPTIFIIGILCFFGIQLMFILSYYFLHLINHNFVTLNNLWNLWTMTSLSAVVVGGRIRMRRLIKLLKQIQQIQAHIEYDTSLEPKVSTMVLVFFGPFFINIVLVVIYIVPVYLIRPNVDALKVIVLLSSLSLVEINLFILLEIQYIFLGFNLYLVVKTINGQINQIIINSKDSMISTDELTNKMLVMCEWYLKIHHILNQINQSEGLIMMVLLFRDVTHIFLMVYSILSTTAMEVTSTIRLLVMVAKIMMFLHNSIRLVCFVEIGFQLQSEINKTRGLFSELMLLPSSNVGVQRKLNNYMYNLLLNQPALAPLGVVTFSRPLIGTIAGAVTSFVIIIYQFEL